MSAPLQLEPARAFLRRRESVAIRSLPGFLRARHRIPAEHSITAARFVHELGQPLIEAEIAAIYQAAKRVLGLRRRQLAQASAEGGGNVDAPQFRFALELGQDPADPARALWQRQLRLLQPVATLPAEFDGIFPVACDELVIPMVIDPELSPSERFDAIVERLEDFSAEHGGEVEEHEAEGRAALSTRDGSRLELDLGRRELVLRVFGCEGSRALFDAAARRFEGLSFDGE